MKKSLYIAAFAALALTACSSEEDRIFDQSAADRLEQYKKEYADVLTSDGGLWQMDYFANEEEPGYVFLMKFDKNGSVTMSANHKWIGGTFKQETSLWKMIADNGPVLTFNSYNNLFHIFSDPANITGPNAPTGDYGDIDETGFGHEGDYEFQVMEVSDDGNTMRLLGKKRLYTIFMHRISESTNPEEYLEKVANVTSFVSPYFDYFNLVDSTGEPFIVQGFETGIVSMYPKLGDFVTQTRSGNVIMTLEGMRFQKTLEVPRADENADPYEAYEFKFQPDGSLLAEDGSKIVGPYPYDAFTMETFDYAWHVDLASVSGKFVNELAKLQTSVEAGYPKKYIEDIYFSYDITDGETVPALNIKLNGTKAAVYYLNFKSASDAGLSYEVVGMNGNAMTIAKKVDYLNDFAEMMAGASYVFTSDDIMKPEVLKMSVVGNENDSMIVEIQ